MLKAGSVTLPSQIFEIVAYGTPDSLDISMRLPLAPINRVFTYSSMFSSIGAISSLVKLACKALFQPHPANGFGYDSVL